MPVASSNMVNYTFFWIKLDQLVITLLSGAFKIPNIPTITLDDAPKAMLQISQDYPSFFCK